MFIDLHDLNRQTVNLKVSFVSIMRIKVKLLLVILPLVLIVGFLGLFIISELSEISYITHESKEANEIAISALDFSVENYHTQLEMWEYAYHPNQERLDAFESHKQTLDELLIVWKEQVDEEFQQNERIAGLYDGGKKDFDNIRTGLKIIEKDWGILIAVIEEYRTEIESGKSRAELNEIDKRVQRKVIENEVLFDKLEFNKNIDKFVISQQTLADNFEIQKKSMISSLSNTLYFIIPVMMTIGLIIIFVISRIIIKPIELLEHATIEMQKGNMDVKVEYKGHDEISTLVNSFKKMRATIKENMEQEKNKTKNEKLTAIGKMASRLAHDLRNPLSIISNEIEIMKLRELYPNEKMQKSQDRISRSIERMTHQLEGVMDFVRTKPLDVENQSVRNLIKSAIKSLVVPSKIKINLPENDHIIICDSTQMGIVFNNLIYNSIQAMKNSGKINVTIFDNLENTVIEFQDSGPGIPENDLETIFEPLFTTKQTGTGLGLVSCRTIVEQHGGTISVKNNPTTFTVMIPKIIEKVEKDCLV